jgi:hypothetical protein
MFLTAGIPDLWSMPSDVKFWKFSRSKVMPFWHWRHVHWWIWLNVSVERHASFFRVGDGSCSFSKLSLTAYQTTRCHIPDCRYFRNCMEVYEEKDEVCSHLTAMLKRYECQSRTSDCIKFRHAFPVMKSLEKSDWLSRNVLPANFVYNIPLCESLFIAHGILRP